MKPLFAAALLSLVAAPLPAFAACTDSQGRLTKCPKPAGGKIVCRPTKALEGLEIPTEEIEWPGAEQTNSTLVVGRKAIIKLFRRLVPGVHPEAEMSRALTERGFTGSPPLLGDVVRIGDDGQTYTLGIVQGFVDNQGDGWAWSLTQLDRTVEEASAPFAEAHDQAQGRPPYPWRRSDPPVPLCRRDHRVRSLAAVQRARRYPGRRGARR